MGSPAAALAPLFEANARGPQIENPQDIALKQAAIRTQQQQQQANALKAQETQRQLGEYQTVRDIVGKYGGDYDKALPELASQVSPDTYQQITKSVTENKTAAANAEKAHQDLLESQQRVIGDQQKAIQATKTHIASIGASLGPDATPAALLANLDLLDPKNESPEVNQVRQHLAQGGDPKAVVMEMIGEDPEVLKSFQANQLAKTAQPSEIEGRQAETELKKVDTATKQKALDILNAASDPEDYYKTIDSVANGNNALAGPAKSGVDFYLAKKQPDKAKEVVQKLIDTSMGNASAVAQQAALLPGEVSKAKQVEAATLPGKIQTAAAEANAREAVTGSALDREAKQFGAAHEKSMNDANTQIEKIMDARNMINGNAEAQALGIVKALTALAGGPGSGVRITQPELKAIAEARGVTGDVQGFFNSLSGKGKLTSTQQSQLTGILDDVRARIEQKRQIASDALDTINGAKDRGTIINADKAARGKIADLEKAPNTGTTGSIRVKRKSDGKTGTIDAKDFDAAKYDKL